MASQIPQIPLRPTGPTLHGVFWLGVLVGVGVFFGSSMAFSIYLSIGYDGGRSGQALSGMSMECAWPQATFFVDRRPKSIGHGQVELWKIADPKFSWNCGDVSYTRPETCAEGTEYLLVMRYRDSDWLDIRCWVPSSTRMWEYMEHG